MKIVGISGSPSAASRSAGLLRHVHASLEPVAAGLHVIDVRELPAQALLHGDGSHPAIRRAVEAVAAADAVIVATPIYKASYSGVLKTFLDLLPADALRGKTVLPLASGGSLGHLLALEYALKPVLSALGARDILDPVFATDEQLPRDAEGRAAPARELRERIAASLAPLLARGAGLVPRRVASSERAEPGRNFLARIQPLVPQEIQ